MTLATPTMVARRIQIPGRRTVAPCSLTPHVDGLYRAAWALSGSSEDAEDLVRETFARALSHRGRVRGEEQLPYLMRVLRKTFLTGRRAATRRAMSVAAREDLTADDPRPIGSSKVTFEIREVYSAISKLPDDVRLALVAVDVLRLSHQQASRALKVSEATLTTRLSHARSRLGSRLLDPASNQSGSSLTRVASN
jgi:RNA polymerase sigma-70 factor, ECF subfamily